MLLAVLLQSAAAAGLGKLGALHLERYCSNRCRYRYR